MSSGKSHARASRALSPVAGISAGAFAEWMGCDSVGIALAVAGGFVGCAVLGQIFSPDLDQQSITRSEWMLIARLGPFSPLGWAFVAYWSIYAWAIPHRHAISHAPVLSTVIRIAYQFFPLLLVRDWIAEGMTVEIAVLWASAVYGLMISDSAHCIMDFFPKRKKRRASRRRRRWV